MKFKNQYIYLCYIYFVSTWKLLLLSALLMTCVDQLLGKYDLIIGLILGGYVGLVGAKAVSKSCDHSSPCQECQYIFLDSELNKVELEDTRKEFGKTVSEIFCCADCEFKLKNNSYKFILAD